MCDQATEVIVLSATPLKDTVRDLYGPVRMVGATSETYKEFTNGVLLQGKREVVGKKLAEWAAGRLATCPCYIARPLYRQTLTTAPGPEIEELYPEECRLGEWDHRACKCKFRGSDCPAFNPMGHPSNRIT